MKFVLGKAHPLVESDWYVVINEDSAELVANLFESACRGRCNTIGINALKLNTQVPHAALGACVRAACEAPFTISNRFGWYANRMGGMCQDLKEIQSETESDTWPELMTPEELIRTVKISKWFGGPHWYAKLADGREVECDGVRKWKTAEKAKQATRFFVKCLDPR
jgi:hypothetical protein